MISIKSARAEELPRGHLIALITNDSRRSVTRRGPKIGSGEAAAPHSTPWGCPFASPRNRPDVASFHVPHPHVCGPQSHWDRCTSLHIRGARGPLRWRFHHRPLKYSCGDTVSSSLEARISSKFVIACKSSSDGVSTATRNQCKCSFTSTLADAGQYCHRR